MGNLPETTCILDKERALKLLIWVICLDHSYCRIDFCVGHFWSQFGLVVPFPSALNRCVRSSFCRGWIPGDRVSEGDKCREAGSEGHSKIQNYFIIF